MFICKPYFSCPKCKKDDCYGVLSIHQNSYTRRCRECWHTDSYDLPDLEKKVIYIDQFAISDMMKATNDKLGKKDKVEKFWIMLFEKLDVLSRLQLITCPDSAFHRNESALYDFRALKKMYEHFSQGATFREPSIIRNYQLVEGFRKYLKLDQIENFTRDDIISGAINGWQDTIRIEMNFDIPQQDIENMRKSRLETQERLTSVFNRWKGEKSKQFNDWYLAESMSWGKAIVEKYIRSVMSENDPSKDPLSAIMSEEALIFTTLLHCIPNTDQNFEYRFTKVVEYLISTEVTETPFNKINSQLWASIAHQAAHGGRKKSPNKGMDNDIEMISTLLPYCDAMFIDNEMYGILTAHKDIKKEIAKYQTRIYSYSNKGDFLAYLDSIKTKASKAHMNKVAEVYGEDWGKPYFDIYSD